MRAWLTVRAQVGRGVLRARAANQDPVAAVVDSLGAVVLLQGTVSSVRASAARARAVRACLS